jgi:hypothetical protein
MQAVDATTFAILGPQDIFLFSFFPLEINTSDEGGLRVGREIDNDSVYLFFLLRTG